MTPNEIKLIEDFNYIVKYLNERGVPFLIKTHYNDDNEVCARSLFGVKVTKKGKFYRANGKIIATNHLYLIEKFI
jgi:hypothetical protein